MDSLRDQRFSAYLKKKTKYPFASKLLDFCLINSDKNQWDYFEKYDHFPFKAVYPFRRLELHFKKNYARVWMPLSSTASIDEAKTLISKILGSDCEIGVQDGSTMRALHPVIDNDEKCEAFIEWLSQQKKQILSTSNVKTASQLFKSVKQADIINAIDAYDDGFIHEFGPSTQYDLIHEGKPYPPKAILGIACKNVKDGRLLRPEEFSGGEDSICFKTLRREGFTVQPKGRVNQAKQDLSVAPNIFCMLMVHFFLSQRESMANENEVDDIPLYFPDDAKKYLEFSKVKTYLPDIDSLGTEDIVPMLEELVGEIFPYFSFMSRIAPELSRFAKSMLFNLDKSEQYVEAYKIGVLAYLSILDSENFDSTHYHCLGALLRSLSDGSTNSSVQDSSYFINLIKSSMGGAAQNLLVEEKFSPIYFTNNKILDRIISLAPPRAGSTVRDPACGLGGFLFKSFDKIYSRERSSDFSISTITGSDIDPMSVNLSKVFYMCKVFFTDTECMGHVEMAKFLGEIAPNIRLIDSLSSKDGLSPSTRHDLIYCNPPFDDLVEEGEESRYNHHGFIAMVEKFVEQDGRGVLLLPQSFLTSERDEGCRRDLLSRRLINRIDVYQNTTFPEDSKIALLLKEPGGTAEPKIRFRTLVGNRPNKKFEVRYSKIIQGGDFSLNTDKMEQMEETKFPLPSHSPEILLANIEDEMLSKSVTTFSGMLSDEISRHHQQLEDISKGLRLIEIYSKELSKINSSKFYTKIETVLEIKFMQRYEDNFGGRPHCFLPLRESRGFSPIHIAVFPYDYDRHYRIHHSSSGLVMLPELSKLDPNYFKLWFRFSGILGRPFSLGSGGEKVDYYVKIVDEKLARCPIFIPPLSLQQNLVEIMKNKHFLQHLINSRRFMPSSFRQDLKKKDIFGLIFRY